MEFFIRWFSMQLAFVVLAISAGAIIICVEKIKKGDFEEKRRKEGRMRYTYYSWCNGKYITCTFAEFNNAFLNTESFCREFYCDEEGNTYLNLVSKSNGKIYYKRKGVYIVCPKDM